MHLLWSAGGIVSLVLRSLPSQAQAQADTASQNVTLRFFSGSQESSCDYGSTGSALTFTTSSVPAISHCFDFAELFSGSATQGLVNQTANGEAGIYWSLENAGNFDKQANYSRVLYRQHVSNAANDEDKPGHHADRKVTLYGGKDCTEATASGTSTPWYGFSCWSEDAGSCGTLPYGIVSFSIQSKSDNVNKDEKCWAFAENGQKGQEGAAAHAHASSKLMLGAFAGVSVMVWMAL